MQTASRTHKIEGFGRPRLIHFNFYHSIFWGASLIDLPPPVWLFTGKLGWGSHPPHFD